MNTRRSFLVGFGAGLILVMGGAFAQMGKAAVSPPDAVRTYLAARARRDLAGQYALFSTTTQSQIPFAQFDTAFASDKAPLSHAAEDGMSPLLTCVSVFFIDAHGLSGYQFTVVGPDPADPQVVLVHAQPPRVSLNKAFLLKIVTSDTGSGPQLQMEPSYQRTSAHDAAEMEEHAKGLASISNLRQIGLAMILYAEAHDDYLPPARTWADALLLLPYWKSPTDSNFHPIELFRDPSAPAGQPWNYAFNRNLAGVRLSDIKDPAATVMLFESTSGVKNATDTGQSLPHPGRHSGGSYYVFADGRAKWFADGTKLSFQTEGK
jgi:prepilin-type processing-associated H-X9-DG protein